MESNRVRFCALDAALVGDIAWQISKEGHGVRYYTEAESDREIADDLPVGGTPNTGRLEDDRGYAVEILEAYETTLGHWMTGFQLQRRAEGVEPVNADVDHCFGDSVNNSPQCTEGQTAITAA